MILAAVIAMKKMKPRAGSLSFCQLLLYCGIATFIMGAITGGFFGDALVKIGGILGKPEGWGELPSLFTPLNDTVYVLSARWRSALSTSTRVLPSALSRR